jgi:hypothetical protein
VKQKAKEIKTTENLSGENCDKMKSQMKDSNITIKYGLKALGSPRDMIMIRFFCRNFFPCSIVSTCQAQDSCLHCAQYDIITRQFFFSTGFIELSSFPVLQHIHVMLLFHGLERLASSQVL